MNRLFEVLCVNRELHSYLFAPVCSKYNLTQTEMMVLLFLKEHGDGNTAADIVSCLKIAKSHVSTSVRDLMERGLIMGNYEGKNHRSIHLQLCESAKEIVAEGKRIEKKYISIVSEGFSQEDKKALRNYLTHMAENANRYLKENG